MKTKQSAVITLTATDVIVFCSNVKKLHENH